MNIGFSFNKELIIVAMQHIKSIMPDSIEIYSYHVNFDGKMLFTYTTKDNYYSSKEIINKDEQIKVSQFRKNIKTTSKWLKKSDLPIVAKDVEYLDCPQFDIFDENEHLVLCLRINSIYDSNNDVISIVLQPDLNIFGIDTGSMSLTTENKSLISTILYKSVIAVLNNSFRDKKNLESFSEKTKSVISKSKNNKKLFEESKNQLYQHIINLANTYLQELTSTYDDIDFIFSDTALNSLKKFKDNPLELKEAIRSAIDYAYNLNSGNSSVAVIEEDFLHFGQQEIFDEKNINTISKSQTKLPREIRVEKMLDDLEFSLKKLLSTENKITGKTLGEFCSPSKSAAAITEYLKKHQTVINKLINMYPDRWSLLKQHFRPFQNIISYKLLPKSKTA